MDSEAQASILYKGYIVLRLASSFKRLRSASRLFEVPASSRARTRLPSLPLLFVRLRRINSFACVMASHGQHWRLAGCKAHDRRNVPPHPF